MAWAVPLIGTGLWAGRTNRRWMLKLSTMLSGIQFCTQWFSYVGATPASLLLGGVMVLVFAVLLWRLHHNRNTTPTRSTP